MPDEPDESPPGQWMPGQPPGRIRTAVPARVAAAVERDVRLLYARHDTRLPFHGWHHVRFVRDKAMEFAAQNSSDVRLVGVAALVHDVNYLVRRNSSAAAGRELRMDLLTSAGASADLARRIDRVVCEAEMATRHRNISVEAQALSDADTLFKALPITPVVLAHRYLAETGASLRGLAHKIVGEQQGRLDQGFYFYNRHAAERYSDWAVANLTLWQCILASLDDPVVDDLVRAVDPTLVDRAAG
jgi:uncharacterized protein